MMSLRDKPTSLWLACLGAGVGIALGFAAAFNWLGFQQLPSSAVARVNHVEISRSEYDKALNMLSSEKRDPLTLEDRTLVLNRLIEEELLVQHGLSLELLRRDPKLRASVVKSLIQRVTFEDAAKETAEVSAEETASPDVVAHESSLEIFMQQLRAEASIEWVNR
jgi:SurA-like N-terminal domain